MQELIGERPPHALSSLLLFLHSEMEQGGEENQKGGNSGKWVPCDSVEYFRARQCIKS